MESIERLGGTISMTNSPENLKRAEKVLIKLRQANLVGSVYEDSLNTRLEQGKKALLTFREQGLHRFDIFRQAGFYADENRFSDAIATLLDPRAGHQLNILPLKMLLETIHTKAPTSSANQIRSLLEQNQPYISIFREKREGKTIPDIEVVGQDFIIFIENKIRGGRETQIQGEWQTKRQWKVLKDKCKRFELLGLAIFLTPEGKLPAEKAFVPLSVGELTSVLRSAVIAAETCPSPHAIQAFLDFYAWE